MRCDQIRERLLVALDFPDTGAEAEEIRRHLENCAACREVADRLDRLADLLNESTVPPVPERFAGQVLAAARSRIMPKYQVPRSSASWLRRWNLTITPARLLAAATLLVGLTAGSVMSWQTWQPSQAQTVSTEPSPRDPLALYSAGLSGNGDSGSLTEVYLALVSGPIGRGE